MPLAFNTLKTPVESLKQLYSAARRRWLYSSLSPEAQHSLYSEIRRIQLPGGSKSLSGHSSQRGLDFRQYFFPTPTISPCISLKIWARGARAVRLMREGRWDAPPSEPDDVPVEAKDSCATKAFSNIVLMSSYFVSSRNRPWRAAILLV